MLHLDRRLEGRAGLLHTTRGEGAGLAERDLAPVPGGERDAAHEEPGGRGDGRLVEVDLRDLAPGDVDTVNLVPDPLVVHLDRAPANDPEGQEIEEEAHRGADEEALAQVLVRGVSGASPGEQRQAARGLERSVEEGLPSHACRPSVARASRERNPGAAADVDIIIARGTGA